MWIQTKQNIQWNRGSLTMMLARGRFPYTRLQAAHLSLDNQKWLPWRHLLGKVFIYFLYKWHSSWMAKITLIQKWQIDSRRGFNNHKGPLPIWVLMLLFPTYTLYKLFQIVVTKAYSIVMSNVLKLNVLHISKHWHYLNLPLIISLLRKACLIRPFYAVLCL
jgi:hypothetical protein